MCAHGTNECVGPAEWHIYANLVAGPGEFEQDLVCNISRASSWMVALFACQFSAQAAVFSGGAGGLEHSPRREGPIVAEGLTFLYLARGGVRA